MNFIKELIEMNTINPSEFGVGALDKTAKKVAAGEPDPEGMTTYLLQRTRAEEEESSQGMLHQNTKIEDILNTLYSMHGDKPLEYLYTLIGSKQITMTEFKEIMSIYSK